MNIGEKIKLNNGEMVTVVENNGWDKIKILMKRGNTKIVQKANLLKGVVFDPMKPSLCGVGFIGVGKHKSKNKDRSNTPAYSHWHDMICRCYNEKRLKKFPTYASCTVCREWHNFQVFAEWFADNYVAGMELDKDIKIKGNKEYSPLSCSWVSRDENNEAATAGRFTFKNPDGAVVNVFNLSKFCRENLLEISCMSMVHSGKRKSHRKWTR